MFRSEVYRATVVIALFWWTALTIYSVFQYGSDWQSAFYSWKYVLFGIGFAPFFVAGIIILTVKNRASMMEASSGLNMTSTLGAVPGWLKPPRMCEIPKIPKLPKRILKAINSAGKKNQAYKNIAVALLRILGANIKLPASPYETGHGEETLFSHTVKVTLKTLIEAENFSYTGIESTSGRLILGLRDSNYKFDPNDPLILLAALAHDIGKIDAFIIKKGKIAGINSNHDTFSMLMLARMPEFSQLSFAEGRALLGAVGYYHAPQTLPLDSVKRAADDRTIAILELLRRCDIEASAAEDGVVEKIPHVEIKTGRNKVVSDLDIWNAFLALIQEPSRVNGTSGQISVGQKCDDLVYFSELKVRGEIIKLLGIADPGKRGDGTHPLSIRLLAILADKGLLMNSFENKEYGPTRAFFTVEFLDRNNGRKTGGWPATFIVHPDVHHLPILSKMKSHASRAVIIGPLMGAHAARNKKVSGSGVLDSAAETSIPVSGEAENPAASAEPESRSDNLVVPAAEYKEETYSSPFPTVDPGLQQPDAAKIQADRVGQIAPESTFNNQAAGVDQQPEADTHEVAIIAGEIILTEEEKKTLEADSNSEMYSACDTHAEMEADERKREKLVKERKAELRKERESGLPFNQKNALRKIDEAIGSGVSQFKDTETLAAEAVAAVIAMWQKDDKRLSGIAMLGTKNPKNLFVRLDGLKRILPEYGWDVFIERGIIETRKNDHVFILANLP